MGFFFGRFELFKKYWLYIIVNTLKQNRAIFSSMKMHEEQNMILKKN